MQKKIKIGFDARVLEWQRGALANFLLNIKEHWTSKNNNYDFYFFFQDEIPSDLIFNKNEHPILIKGPKFLKKKFFTDVFLFGKSLNSHNIEIFFATIYSYPFHSFKNKTILFLWDITFTTHRKHYGFIRGNIYHFMSKLSAKYATKIITCSKYDMEIIKANYQLDDKVSYIELPAGSNFKDNSLNENKISFLKKYSFSDNYLLSLGVMYNRRCIYNLLLAYQELIKEEKITEKLVLVGRNAANPKKPLSDLISNLSKKNLINYIEFIAQQDLNDLYSFASLYICVSTNDGESIMIKEAALSGTAVLTNKLLSESIDNHCFLVEDPHSIDSWKKSLIESINQNKSIKIEKAKSYVRNISWDKIIRYIESLI